MMMWSPKAAVAPYVSRPLLPACRTGTSHHMTALQLQALQLLIFLLSSGAVGAPQQVSGLCHEMAPRTLYCFALPYL